MSGVDRASGKRTTARISFHNTKKHRFMLQESNLHKYQKTGVDHVLNNPFCGLFFDMGLGKTATTLTALNWLMNVDLEIGRVLIIAPKRVVESVWSAEIEKWEHLKNLRISKVSGSEKRRLQALKSDADIFLIGRDNVAWLCGHFGGLKLPFDMLVIDESSSFKNPNSQRFKALRRVQPSFDRVVLLTGTPAPNGLADLWGQIYLLDRGERLGKTLESFRNDFVKPDKYNGAIVYSYKIRSKDHEKRLHDNIKDICLSMKAADYLELPDRIDNFVEVVFPPKLQADYEAFEKEKVLEIEDSNEEISALNAAALYMKLLQFSNGAIYGDGGDWHEVHKLKLDALSEIVENANGVPVLVAYSFKHDKERILKALKKYNPVQFDGDEHVKAWNRCEIPVMVMHPASGGHGLNLQSGGNLIVWFGLPRSLELYQQFNARILRQGADFKNIVIHHLCAKGTMDGDVMAGLRRKTSLQDALLAAVKAKIAKYLRD